MKVSAKLYEIHQDIDLRIITYVKFNQFKEPLDCIDVYSNFFGEFELDYSITKPSPNWNYNNDQVKWATYTSLISYLTPVGILYDLK